ncbi:MAG: type II toxin-antitoxin system VapC family toxin [Prochlorothrix sp.]
MTTERVDCVVDASIAIKLFIAQEDSDIAELLFLRLFTLPKACFAVPSLFYVECANVFWKYVRQAGLPSDQAQVNLQRLKALDLQVYPLTDLVEQALEVAMAYSISVYDACYVVLSQWLQCPLVTADRRLIKAMTNTSYSVVILTEFLR